MDIGFFIWEYPPHLVGGLGTYAREITRIMRKRGHRISVFTLNVRKNPHEFSFPPFSIQDNIEVHRPYILDMQDILYILSDELKRWGEGINLFNDIFAYNFLSASKFINKLQYEENYDIISIHDWLSSIAGILIKRNTNFPVVFHVHSTEELRSNLSNTIKSFEHKMGSMAEKIITVSYAMKQHMVEIGYPEEKIEVVWNGIDPSIFDPKRVKKELREKWKEHYKIDDKTKVILYVGRLTYIKGVENLVRSLPHVLREKENVKLVIVGIGEERDKLINLSYELGIKDKVAITSKWLSIEDLLAHYSIADVCVFPSLSEPFGIVSLEAMAMEKPVVVGAKGVSGFAEQVINEGEGKCGVHINPADPQDIAKGILEVLNNEESAKEWGKNGRKRVVEMFTLEETVDKTLKIYEELIR